MSFLSRLTGFFSGSSGEEGLLRQGLEHAKAKRPEKAIEIYNSLLTASSTSAAVRARALFNRALAYSSMKDDEKALADLKQVLAMPTLPDNVQSAARAQVARIKKRSE